MMTETARHQLELWAAVIGLVTGCATLGGAGGSLVAFIYESFNMPAELAERTALGGLFGLALGIAITAMIMTQR